jgi:SPOR domain
MAYPLGSVDTDEQPGFYPQPGERGARSRFGRLATALAVLTAIALVAGGLWFAYLLGTRQAGGSNSADVPLIRADERPTKVKPQNPGGMEIPDRDKLIYTQKRAGVEHLLPPPEKPMPRPTTTATAPPEAPSLPTAAPAAPLPAGGAVASAKPQQMAAKAPPPPAELPPAKTGATRIQLGSVRSEEAARQEWERLKRTNTDVLGGLSAVPVRADLGEKGVFYRILTGPIADAERVCRELNHRNVGCILVR